VKIGLVMGAGGVVGTAWLMGGLEALAEVTGWDPMEADHVVGTSAGSLVATMAAGRRPFAARPDADGSTDGTSDSSARGAPPGFPTVCSPRAPSESWFARWHRRARRAGGSGHPGLRLEPRPTAQVSP